jgi:hypothetical protein
MRYALTVCLVFSFSPSYARPTQAEVPAKTGAKRIKTARTILHRDHGQSTMSLLRGGHEIHAEAPGEAEPVTALPDTPVDTERSSQQANPAAAKANHPDFSRFIINVAGRRMGEGEEFEYLLGIAGPQGYSRLFRGKPGQWKELRILEQAASETKFSYQTFEEGDLFFYLPRAGSGAVIRGAIGFTARQGTSFPLALEPKLRDEMLWSLVQEGFIQTR